MGKGGGKGAGKGGDMEESSLAVGCCGLLVAISTILLLLSFSTVEPLEVALHFSKFSNKIVSEKSYTGGRYFLGLGHSFITFPTQAVTIDFTADPGARERPLATRTSDGLPVTLQISMQYILKQDKIKDLYTELNTAYEDTFVRFVRDTMLEVAGRYDSYSYWTRRNLIGAEMQMRLDQDTSLSKFAHVRACQLLTVLLPEQFETSILNTQIAVQNQRQAGYNQEVKTVEANTLQQVNVYNNTVTVYLRNANAESEQIKREAIALARRNTVQAESAAYSQAQTILGLDSTQLAEYRWYHTMMDSMEGAPNRKLLINMQSNQNIVNLGGQ